jgi:8-hydroxy-5-deazaflavin:NADPH oxidoreductase
MSRGRNLGGVSPVFLARCGMLAVRAKETELKIAILGSGAVGVVLANGLRAHGHDITLASRTAKTVDGWDGDVATFADAAGGAEAAVLAVKGSIAEDLVAGLATPLAGKVVLDTTNPIADVPPQDGVLSYFTGPNESLMERLQAAAPEAHFVKAFNSVGNARMVDPVYPGDVRPTMFIAGNDAEAKQIATDVLEDLGWEVADMGTAAGARAIEPLCILWCIPGLNGGGWTHAFKLLTD